MNPLETSLRHLQLENDGLRVEIFEQGAHVSRAEPMRGGSLLFLSQSSRLESGAAIRGGIPLCFPWFGPKADDSGAPSHGFARTMTWNVVESNDHAAILSLHSGDATRLLWPHDFAATSRVVTINGQVQVHFRVENTGNTPFSFEVALHAYFQVSDVRHIEIEGLEGKTYLDKVENRARKVQTGRVTIEGETDRVYLDAGGPLVLRDGERRVKIAGDSGWRSSVVWNPWIEKARALADLGDDEWTQFVCIEAGAVAEDAVTLQAGQSYGLTLEITP